MAQQLVRVRSPAGMVKVPVDATDSLTTLYDRAANQLGVDPQHIRLSRQPQGQPLPREPTPLGKATISHGDLLHAEAEGGKWADIVLSSQSTAKGATAMNDGSLAAAGAGTDGLVVVEDPVDQELDKLSGLIVKSSEKNGMRRVSDLPLEPYDTDYMKEKQIKHMSFHAMIRKLQNKQRSSGVTTSKTLQLLQDEVDDLARKTVKKDKSSTIRLSDLPSAVVLKSQDFRIVDHVEFETHGVIDKFLGSWRSTGCQRFGYMYGRYEPYQNVPLGIKAVVAFIYEPPQVGHPDGLDVAENDPDDHLVNGIARLLGLRRVGMIFTDLTDDGTGQGRVLVKRHANTFFLTAVEVVWAAQQQLAHQNACKYSNTGKYGSKFVTVVVSGDPSIAEGSNIGLAAYQVSNQAMAMAQAEIVQPTVDLALMRVVRDDNRVIPDVLYRFQNEYGSEVTQAAKPTFPVEYLLVNATHGFPNDPKPTLLGTGAFPIENRPTEAATHAIIFGYLKQSAEQLGLALSDFHVLLALAKTGIFNLDTDFTMLCEAVSRRDPQYLAAATQTESWRNLLAVLQAGASPAAVSNGTTSAPEPMYEQQMGTLLDMGFEDEENNLRLLRQYDGSIERVLQELTDH